MVKTFINKELGLEAEIGRIAKQADGAVWLKQGGTVVLASVVSSPSSEFPGFLPLTIEYRENFSAAGKIPGGYFKREGKTTDREILTARLIDRSLRPLFPENYFDQVQIVVNVYSVDKENMPGDLGFIAASMALAVSKIPFLEPVGIAQVARIKGQWVVNPTFTQSKESDVRLVVAGPEKGINMVEGSMNEVSEKELLDAFFLAHDTIRKQIAWQHEIAREIGKPKEAIVDPVDWKLWSDRVLKFLTPAMIKSAFVTDKVERNQAFDTMRDSFKAQYSEDIEAQAVSDKILSYLFDYLLKEKISEVILKDGKRIDGRDFTTVRPIETEVGLLPFTHGSALFTRGRTQALATLTLGGGQDAQKVEELMGEEDRHFMLHYNFLPFSTGEVKPMRGPGRREIGHGYLAKSAIEPMLPNQEKFPYTIRIVADILESDGSSSMATVCSSVMSLLNGGVPIKKMVSGVAMGLIGDQGKFQALTDINGTEDAFGLMDFKVAGTHDGITAIQMDIKYKGGLPREVFEAALSQAREGRLHILKEMQKVMTAPNPKLSELVPQVVSFKVPTDKIGAIIGSGGKTIREIIDATGTMIDIESDGLVKVYGQPGPKLDHAVKWVKMLAGQIEVGETFDGKIRRLAEFGLFVELVPGVDGLLHISAIPREKQRELNRFYQVDDVLKVIVADYDPASGRIRLKIVDDK